MNTAPETASISDNQPLRHNRWWLAAVRWLPLLPILPFLPLFLLTALPRLLVPFELEWNEGHSAEQAWRFAMGMPLYPEASTGWVPYMYAPLYHVVHGWLIALSGVPTLAWGRVVSFLCTLLSAQAIAFIVHDHSRRVIPAVGAGLLYFAYYKPTGFWYDIVRVDALAFALVGWGMYFTLKRHPRGWQVAVGLVLLALATWAKQTNGVIAVLCAGWTLLHAPRATLLTSFVIAVATANAVFLMMRGGSEWLPKYVYTNAIAHPSMPHVWFPGYLHPGEFLALVEDPGSMSSRLGTYIHLWLDREPPRVWIESLRHAWLLLLPLPVWILRCIVLRRRPRGLHHAVPCIVLAILGIQGFAKFGGYVNNFVPVYLAACILLGLSWAGIEGTLRGPWRRAALGAGIFLLVALQVLQPWNIPAATDAAATWRIIRHDPNEERRKAMEAWTRHLALEAQSQREGWELKSERPEISTGRRLRFFVGRLNEGGLGWFPSHQQPHRDSAAAHRDLMDWLAGLHREGTPVLVIHHQWYGILAGHAMGPNIDMIRCAHWAGDPIPRVFLDDLRSGRWPYLVLGAKRVEWEWLAGNVGDVINANYVYQGIVPPMAPHEHTRAMMPVTGAEIRPLTLWRHRSHVAEKKDAPPDALGGAQELILRGDVPTRRD